MTEGKKMATTSEKVKAQIQVTNERLWVSDNGSVTCDNHAGVYLASEIKAKPKAKSHRTPLGTWDAYALNLLGGLPCETCVDWSSLDLSEEA